jgi:hypothetical protein
MDVGFLILGPDRNVAGLINTLGSIRNQKHKDASIYVAGNDATDEDLKEFSVYCPSFKGGNTITSLVNTGMKKIKSEWVCIVFGGSRIPFDMEKKWETFCKSESDILYPIVEKKYNFVDGTFNGVLINKKFFLKVGKFPNVTMQKHGMNDFEFVKLLWATDALQHGAMFKGIVGMRVI